jgi:hypothetical protein
VCGERVENTERGLVVRTGDGPGERGPAGQQPLDHPGPADGQVIPLPGGPVDELGPAPRDLLGQRVVPGQVVRAVHVAAEVAHRVVAVVDHQVPGNLAHP